jgi:hypothetical protein
MSNIIGVASGQDSIYAPSFGSRVETLKQSESAKSEGDSDKHTKNRTKLVDGDVTIETYTEDGKLLKITPPGYLPFKKIA